MSIPQKRPHKDIDAPSSAASASPVSERSRSRRKRKVNAKKEATIAVPSGRTPPWTLVGACGGRLKSQTVFSKDEKHLFAATNKVVKVFSVTSGQFVRAIGAVQQKGNIVDFIVDPLNHFRIIIAYSTAVLCVYDWTDGLRITHCKMPEACMRLSAVNNTLLLLTPSALSVCQLPLPMSIAGESVQVSVQSVLDLDSSHASSHLISVSDSAVCIASRNVVWLSLVQDPKLSHSNFAWKQFNLPHSITSVDCVNDTLAFGDRSGVIRLYFGLSESIKSDKSSTEGVIRWHQSPVTSLQFSHNGLYLLSGAREDVLMISQLSSGHRQFIPRLGGEIIGISQSKSGSFYSLLLSTNNIKIINVATLELVSEVSGILYSPPVKKQEDDPVPRFPSVALIRPHHEHLYISGTDSSSAMLQAYNLRLDQQVLRFDVGRLSRVKQTGTRQRPVAEPKVMFAAFTSDGSWLATIDKWTDPYALDEISSPEVMLKFWGWNGKNWDVVTKIESPHGLCDALGLASPQHVSVKQEFATLGADGKLKFWIPIKRPSSSDVVWSLDRIVGSNSPTLHLEGALVYSNDGSILAAAIGNEIHIIDMTNDHVIKSLYIDLRVSRMEILGRHLLCLHEKSSIFSGRDIATGEVLFTERLDRPFAAMAVDHVTSTFALATASFPTGISKNKPSKPAKSTIVVSRIVSENKVDEAHIYLNSVVVTLLGAVPPELVSGFIFIDASGEIGFIGQNHTTIKPSDGQTRSIADSFPTSITQGGERKVTEMKHQPTLTYASLGEIHTMFEASRESDLTHIYETIVQNL